VGAPGEEAIRNPVSKRRDDSSTESRTRPDARRPISLSDRVQIDPDVVFRELSGEAVLLNLLTGIYFGLNAVGTRMWALLNERVDLGRVAEALRDEYDISAKTVETDLLRLCEELREKGLLQVSP
jgi:hypothetical protein